jgi:TatD DNase family protein
MRYIDVHAHVQFDAFDEDREVLVNTMREREVSAIMVGVDKKSSEEGVRLANMHDHFTASVGLHPNDVLLEEFDTAFFTELGSGSKVVAVGECGLDYYRLFDDVSTDEAKHIIEKQKELFRKHVELAVLLDKPLIIHARPTKGTQNAYEDVIAILKEYKELHGKRVRGDIHFFVGGVVEARALVELGFTLSFTAVLTFTHDYDEVIRHIPLTSILSETDAPYIAPEGRRGKRNDPLAVMDVVSAIARIRGEDEELVRTTLLENASRVFFR